ncbi:LPS export ABC transporter permease LptF [Saccharospirillum salsuginis]|uniref:Lipopolysaccharide export system permease protein LptF n=1 Tax=Saccharospirillum salsuginis TaxID=418750 RepID=A0A918NBJ4_9GAMM|nr:LPS export ABC transporter permease LptF [Saccharospirillum salsuginis]GGX60475.1 LPS export ABC transporter permease LptF [Saccharospirillum salsuginis]
MITRYLCRETLKPFALITLILTVLFIAEELSNVLAKAISGQYSDWAIAVILGYQLPIMLPELLPAAYFLALLIAMNRMSQESERTVLMAIGINDASLFRRLFVFTAVPVTLLLLGFSHLGAPMAEKGLAQFILQQQNRPLTELVQAGEFFTLSERQATLYARSADTGRESLLTVFMARTEDDRITINTADRARIQVENDRQYLSLQDGQQQVFSLAPSNTTRIDYERYNLYIPQSEEEFSTDRLETRSTAELWQGEVKSKSEVVYRTLQGLMIPVLCIWAVALTRVKPRKARVGALAFGIVLYILFNFGYRTAQAAVAKGQIPLEASPWWLHLGLFLVGVYLLRKSAR